jgi:hypothetical protein
MPCILFMYKFLSVFIAGAIIADIIDVESCLKRQYETQELV